MIIYKRQDSGAIYGHVVTQKHKSSDLNVNPYNVFFLVASTYLTTTNNFVHSFSRQNPSRTVRGVSWSDDMALTAITNLKCFTVAASGRSHI